MTVQAFIVKRANLTRYEIDSMWDIFRKFFSNVNKNRFLKDLSEKHWVILQKNSGGKIVGFSTQQCLKLEHNNRKLLCIFSGDTIVMPEYWRSSKIAGAFGHFMFRVIKENPTRKIYWLLISKGYRTYRFLPVFFNEFYPRYDVNTPDSYQQLIDYICTKKFNGHYVKHKGIISFNKKGDRLNSTMRSIPHHKINDKHVGFFLTKNPGFRYGDELACVAELSLSNLKKSGIRVINKTKVTWHE